MTHLMSRSGRLWLTLALPACIATSACDGALSSKDDEHDESLFPYANPESRFLSATTAESGADEAETASSVPQEKGAFLRRTEQSNAEMFETSADQPDLLLKPVNTHVCFLTRVSGQLGGRSIVIVHHNNVDVNARCAAGFENVVAAYDDTGPTWKLNSCQREDNSLRAEATCVPASDFIAEPGGTIMGSNPVYSRVFGDCEHRVSTSANLWPGVAVSFVNGLIGAFAGGGESVEILGDKDSNFNPAKLWTRTETCNTVQGWAYSMFVGLASNPQTMYRNSYNISATRNESKTVKMTKTRDAVCYLTKLSGDFKGNQERIRIYPQKDSAGVEYWMLEAHADRGSAYARAECVFYDQRPGPLQ